MTKKCIIICDNKKRPIGMLEVKDLNTDEYIIYEKLCNENHTQFVEEIKQQRNDIEAEIKAEDEKISHLEKELEWCKHQIAILLGEE